MRNSVPEHRFGTLHVIDLTALFEMLLLHFCALFKFDALFLKSTLADAV